MRNAPVETQVVKNEYLLRGRLLATYVLGPRPKKENIYKKKSIKVDIRQAKTCTGDQASEEGADGEEGEWTSAGVPGSPE